MKILIIEDEEAVGKALKQFLEFKGNEVAHTIDIKGSIAQIDSFDPKVILLDMKLGKEDGMEILKYTKERNKQARVVIMTGMNSELLEQQALKMGAFAYVHKPINIAQINEMIEKM